MDDLTPAPHGYLIAAVRDQTPDVINSSGEPGDLFYRPMDAEERGPFLRQKLGEEAIEYIREPSVKELGDVLAVIDALARDHGVSLGELYDVAVVRHPRGGFRLGMGMYGRHPEYDFTHAEADARREEGKP